MGFLFACLVFFFLNHDGGQALEQRPKETVESIPEVGQILTGQGLNNLL